MGRRCNGWHESGRYPRAVVQSTRDLNRYKFCALCLARYRAYDPLMTWERVPAWQHFCATVARPLERLDARLYSLGFRWPRVDWLGLWSYRIYHGQNPFARLRRVESGGGN